MSVTISSVYYTAETLRSYYNYGGCPTPAVGCFRPNLMYTPPAGWTGATYYTDDVSGIGLMTVPGSTHTYRVDWRFGQGASTRTETVRITVAWPLDGRPYVTTAYSSTVTR